MRLIDADTVVTIQVYDDMTETISTKKMTIADAIDEWSDEGCPPTIDAKPIRYGHWKEHKDYPGLAYLCSNCGYFTTNKSHYCPSCGAKMNGEIEDANN